MGAQRLNPPSFDKSDADNEKMAERWIAATPPTRYRSMNERSIGDFIDALLLLLSGNSPDDVAFINRFRPQIVFGELQLDVCRRAC